MKSGLPFALLCSVLSLSGCVLETYEEDDPSRPSRPGQWNGLGNSSGGGLSPGGLPRDRPAHATMTVGPAATARARGASVGLPATAPRRGMRPQLPLRRATHLRAPRRCRRRWRQARGRERQARRRRAGRRRETTGRRQQSRRCPTPVPAPTAPRRFLEAALVAVAWTPSAAAAAASRAPASAPAAADASCGTGQRCQEGFCQPSAQPGGQCIYSADCGPAAALCINGFCHAGCATARQRPPAMCPNPADRCQQGICRARRAPGAPVHRQRPLPGRPQHCVDAVCRTPCRDDSQCGPGCSGTVCHAGYCVMPEELLPPCRRPPAPCPAPPPPAARLSKVPLQTTRRL